MAADLAFAPAGEDFAISLRELYLHQFGYDGPHNIPSFCAQ
jgi:hypothetical protein